ncbi:MAG: NUDIX hydrolase [Brevibacterium aurantiacum]|uniref:CoA pyrophosphatase n=1 Tax=Brevibacterium aurantiacum TaxID=273384 RepID=A0A2A3Z4J8_BREAU|nr:CoA pyrophosphatase [Brevibacterium aurantiacum]AZT96392.1 CoA pyrophosphatase [Brevibacterium aurantiacum]PCC19045.1 coenzyme A pyrophosphatase [Brevibacterium aurantiacum]PCC41761.1 coenzyme A pyrophosphatase [Brevibacterium aurantiacum]PCC46413.1 coenzyme A pyrophosphatase [Brevibacterium aurantiacum]PCC55970.1 coenzyme A pyrophosphatase [Brevibacterium aurantiacum]
MSADASEHRQVGPNPSDQDSVQAADVRDVVHDQTLRTQLENLAASNGSPEWLRRTPAPDDHSVRDAAVLMLFGRGGQPRTDAGRGESSRLADFGVDVDIVLLQRASTLRNHPGQVAFPGGGRDPEDDSLVAAALREAQEEAGIVPATVDVLGQMDPLYIPVSKFQVTPVIGYWAQPGAVRVMDKSESYSVYRVSVADLVAPANRGTFSRPDLKITTPAFDVGVLKVWGFTAGILDFALDHLGWAGDWDRDAHIDIDF